MPGRPVQYPARTSVGSALIHRSNQPLKSSADITKVDGQRVHFRQQPLLDIHYTENPTAFG